MPHAAGTHVCRDADMAAVMEGGRGSCAALCILYWEVRAAGRRLQPSAGCLGFPGCGIPCCAVTTCCAHAHPLCLQYLPARCKTGLCIALRVPAVVTCAFTSSHTCGVAAPAAATAALAAWSSSPAARASSHTLPRRWPPSCALGSRVTTAPERSGHSAPVWRGGSHAGYQVHGPKATPCHLHKVASGGTRETA